MAIQYPPRTLGKRVRAAEWLGLREHGADAETFSERIYAAVAADLADRGVTVLPNPSQGTRDEAAKYAIANLQSKYDQVHVPLHRRPSRVENGSFTMGDGVAEFEPGKADTLVFIRASGVIQSRGKKALAAVLLNPLLAVSSFQGDISFIDARSGEVLAYLRLVKWKDLTRRPDGQLLGLVHETLRAVPLPVAWQKR